MKSTRRWSATNTIGSLACAASLSLMAVSVGPTGATTLTYTNPDAYFAIAGPQTVQDFNRPISSTPSSVSYPNLVVSCSGSDFCNGFFGHVAEDQGIAFVSPSVATFTFNSPIRSFRRIPALQLKREWSPWPQFGSDPGNPRELSKG
jgi:hypothetical protein